MKKQELKLAFAGTPEISAMVLKALIDNHYNVVAAFTQPDRPAGRGKKLVSSAVKQLAEAHDIAVFQPLSFKKQPEYIEWLKALEVDVMVVVAYGLLLPKIVLDTPKFGCLNIHVSLLPRWRGAAPIQRAIEAGDRETGVCIMQMDEGLDTGDILAERRCDIADDDTAERLHDKLGVLSVPALFEVLDHIEEIKPVKQQGLPCYAHKITKEEARINWQDSATVIARRERAFSPWPGLYFELDGQMIKVMGLEVMVGHGQAPGTIVNITKEGVDVATGDGMLRIKNLQFPGKKMMSISVVLNGRDLRPLTGRKLL
ncbi:MAG: methionyl-tRNA formyltransferase [Francisellaceae bacterium]